jgi:Arm DNA-binding domain/Phage integrase, N-terminal SAM-like domain
MQKLTEATVAALPVDGRDYVVFDALLPGFGLRVTPSGAKIFIARGWGHGRARKVSLGTAPEMTVAQARKEAREALHAIRAGKDPAAERAAMRAAVTAGETTVAALADRWLEQYVVPKLKPLTQRDYVRLLEQRIKPRLGHLAVGRVTKSDVIGLHVALAPTPRHANYVVSTFRALMTFAEDVGLRPPMSNPARRIKMYRERARERFLDETEIARAAECIDAAERAGRIGPHAAAGLRLALLTGARQGEILAAKWEHVDWDRRFIRLPDSKGQRSKNSPHLGCRGRGAEDGASDRSIHHRRRRTGPTVQESEPVMDRRAEIRRPRRRQAARFAPFLREPSRGARRQPSDDR